MKFLIRRHLMRTLALVLFACALTPAYAQQKGGFPSDGNGLLDACSVLVDSADLPSSVTSLSGEPFTEKMGQFNWCAGYLGATQDIYFQNELTLYFMAKSL
jgi:hypothetical protein